MPFQKITAPSPAFFSTLFSLCSSDVEGGRLKHDRLVSLLHKARLNRFFKQVLKIDDENLNPKESVKPGKPVVGAVIGEIQVQYLDAAHLEDKLAVALAIPPCKPTAKSFDVFFRVTNAKTGKEIAVAKEKMICIDMQSEKATAVPKGFRKRLVSLNTIAREAAVDHPPPIRSAL